MAPGVPVPTQLGLRVVSGCRRAPSFGKAALWELDVDGLKGGANAAWIGARLCSSARARKSGPEPRDATGGAPGGARAQSGTLGTSRGANVT